MRPFRRISRTLAQLRFRGRVCVFLVLALLARVCLADSQQPAEDSPQGGVVVHTLSGQEVVTSRSLALESSSPTLTFGNRSAPLASVLSIVLSETRSPDPGVPIAMLASGEELRTRLREGSEDEIVFTCDALGDSSHRLAIQGLRALAFPERFRSGAELLRFQQSFRSARRAPIVPERVDSESSLPPPPIAARAPTEGRDPNKDHVLTAEGSWLSGLLTLVGEKHISFEADDIGAVEISFERLRAVIVAAVDPAAAGAGAPAEGPTIALRGVDGSTLEGELVSIRDEALRLRSRGLGEVVLPLSRVARIDVRGGRVQYLSDLNPARATSRDLFTPRPVQRDSSVRGGPLTLRGKVYRKGLGMRSHTRLDFDLDENHRRFQSIAGIDDDARLTTVRTHLGGAATAIFRVYLDDVVALEKELSRGDAPEKIDLSVEGKKRLALEVDYGPGLWMQDFADWADAKLILN